MVNRTAVTLFEFSEKSGCNFIVCFFKLCCALVFGNIVLSETPYRQKQ